MLSSRQARKAMVYAATQPQSIGHFQTMLSETEGILSLPAPWWAVEMYRGNSLQSKVVVSSDLSASPKQIQLQQKKRKAIQVALPTLAIERLKKKQEYTNKQIETSEDCNEKYQ